MNKKESNLLLPLVIIILSITSFLISNYILMPNINKNLAKNYHHRRSYKSYGIKKQKPAKDWQVKIKIITELGA